MICGTLQCTTYALYRVHDSWFEAVSDTIGPLSSTHLNFGSIIHYSKQNLAYCSAWHQPLHQCLPLFGGFAAQHTILHIWNYIGALLLAAAHSRPYPGPRHLRALVIGTKMGAYMCECVCVWLTVWIKLHVRFENDIRSLNCCWQSNGTQARHRWRLRNLASRGDEQINLYPVYQRTQKFYCAQPLGQVASA